MDARKYILIDDYQDHYLDGNNYDFCCLNITDRINLSLVRSLNFCIRPQAVPGFTYAKTCLRMWFRSELDRFENYKYPA